MPYKQDAAGRIRIFENCIRSGHAAPDRFGEFEDIRVSCGQGEMKNIGVRIRTLRREKESEDTNKNA